MSTTDTEWVQTIRALIPANTDPSIYNVQQTLPAVPEQQQEVKIQGADQTPAQTEG